MTREMKVSFWGINTAGEGLAPPFPRPPCDVILQDGLSFSGWGNGTAAGNQIRQLEWSSSGRKLEILASRIRSRPVADLSGDNRWLRST